MPMRDWVHDDAYPYVDWEALDESALREQIRKHPLVKDDRRHKAERPFRLACIQLCTYDGTVYNVAQGPRAHRPPLRLRVVGRSLDRLQRLPPPLRRPQPDAARQLAPEMPGLFSTQSVHKQGAGFSQASQIHKRDEHLRGQKRYVEHKRFNEAFLINASTSPFYPLFASLDVNAKIHEGKSGETLWDRCIALGIEARKKLREFARHYPETGNGAEERWFFDPFVPDLVEPARRRRRRLGGPSHRRDQARPALLELRSEEQVARLPGHGRRLCDGRSEQADAAHAGHRPPDRRLPRLRRAGHRLANYLREQKVIPEKCDLNSILFLMTPAEDESKLNTLIAKLVKFKNLWDRDAPLAEVLPTLSRRSASATPATRCARSARRCTTSTARPT